MNLSVTLVYLLDALFAVIAIIYILMASIKLVRARNIPGAKPIFGAIVFTLLGAVVSAGYTSVVEDTNVWIEAAIDLALGIAFFIGALGFWRLSKFAVSTGANPPLDQTRANEERAP